MRFEEKSDNLLGITLLFLDWLYVKKVDFLDLFENLERRSTENRHELAASIMKFDKKKAFVIIQTNIVDIIELDKKINS